MPEDDDNVRRTARAIPALLRLSPSRRPDILPSGPTICFLFVASLFNNLNCWACGSSNKSSSSQPNAGGWPPGSSANGTSLSCCQLRGCAFAPEVYNDPRGSCRFLSVWAGGQDDLQEPFELDEDVFGERRYIHPPTFIMVEVEEEVFVFIDKHLGLRRRNNKHLDSASSHLHSFCPFPLSSTEAFTGIYAL